jgi:hypothetical protein
MSEPKRTVLFLITLLFTFSARAQNLVQIKVTDYGWIGSIGPVKDLFDSYLQQAENDLNKQLPLKDPARLNQGMVDATALSSRGLGADYASNMDVVLVGVGVGAGLDNQRDDAITDLPSGLGGAAGLTVGYRYNKQWRLYGNIGGLTASRTFQGILGTDLDAEIKARNFGLHAQYDLFERTGDNLFGWGGLRMTLGYEYNDNETIVTDFLNESLNLDTGAGVVQGRLKGFPKYKIHSKTHSVPLEISSSVNFLWLFSLYAGAGADFNFGSADGSGDVSAVAKSPLQCVSGACTNLSLPEVQAVGNFNAHENVRQFFFRGFGGLQLNLWRVKVYTEASQVFGTKLINASVGVRYVY